MVVHTRPQIFHGIGEESMGQYQGFIPENQWGETYKCLFRAY